jgi:hypothetical protein
MWRQIETPKFSINTSTFLLKLFQVLLVLGAIMIAAGSIISSIFLLHLLTFASQLFYVTPILLIASGSLTILVTSFYFLPTFYI